MRKVLLAAFLAGAPRAASAHHEAIFGPQSSLMLSTDHFVSLQLFTRQLGVSSQRTQETTALFSGGLRPTQRLPLTLTVIAPYSHIRGLDGGPTQYGLEDAILGMRYRHDLKGLQDRWGREGNFVMGMGAIELPSGVIDHKGWTGPLDYMGALMGSLERGRWSALGYVFGRSNGRDSGGSKKGDSLFVGGGGAYTPDEDFKTGRLMSYQLGWSFEHYMRDTVSGVEDPDTGGQEFLLHPTLVFSPGHGILLFGTVSLPVWRDFADPSAQDRYRIGSGIVYAW